MQTENIQTSLPSKGLSVSYQQAIDLKRISELKERYEKLRETARYLFGKKRGAWGRMTQADHKRSAKLDNLRLELNEATKNYNFKYNEKVTH